MEGLFGEGLVDEVLFCCGESLEENLHWEHRPGALAEFEDGVESVRSTLSHLITTSVSHATITHFFVEHGLFKYYLY